MRKPMVLVTLVAIFLVSAAVLAQRQLQLTATISDPTGAEVTTVPAQDVRISEDGQAATILKTEVVTRPPKVQVLIDNGTGFPSEAIGTLRTGLRAFLESLPAGIEVSLVTTAPQPRFLQAATADRARLVAALDRLAPDSGAGRFVESLAEATQRAERDANARYVIVSLATGAGDSNPRERDIMQIQERVLKLGTTVHVALLLTRGTSGGGVVQTDVGQAVTKLSSGRFEVINQASRIGTLLPELGAQMATALASSKQLRVTFERPAGKTGDLGRISMGVTNKVVADLALAQ